MALPVVVSIDSNVVAIVAEDLGVRVRAGGSSDGGGDEQGENDELLAEDTTIINRVESEQLAEPTTNGDEDGIIFKNLPEYLNAKVIDSL